jgi:CubicO group peptidase (beta-lactamase class C family)
MKARSALAVWVGLAAALNAQDAVSLAQRADSYIRAGGLQGSVLLAKGGNVILARGYGLANIELGVENTPATKFRLGSITKQFTAAAILQLAERGRLAVGDPVSKHIPGSPEAWSRVTIHHLLTHTSGIPSYTDRADYRQRMREPAGSPLDFIERFRHLPLDFPPGTRFHYDNSGYYLLGAIIEQVSGMKYEEYLRKNIFEPLQMSDTGYDRPSAILTGRASGYSTGKGGTVINAPFLDMGQPYAAGSLYSTVLDLYKWDRALYTSKVLSPQSIAAAFHPGQHEWSANIRYGYGWGITEVHGHKVVGHGGGINGFSTVIWRAVEEDAVVIVLSNREDTTVGKTGRALLELVLTTR